MRRRLRAWGAREDPSIRPGVDAPPKNSPKNGRLGRQYPKTGVRIVNSCGRGQVSAHKRCQRPLGISQHVDTDVESMPAQQTARLDGASRPVLPAFSFFQTKFSLILAQTWIICEDREQFS